MSRYYDRNKNDYDLAVRIIKNLKDLKEYNINLELKVNNDCLYDYEKELDKLQEELRNDPNNKSLAKKIKEKEKYIPKLREEIGDLESFDEFVEIVEEVISPYALDDRRITVRYPKSLELLAEYDTGDKGLNAENKRLSEFFDKLYWNDFNAYSDKTKKDIKDIINRIRNTRYFQKVKKDAGPLHNPDNETLCGSNVPGTYKDLFDDIKGILEHIDLDSDLNFDDPYKVPTNEEYDIYDYDKKTDEMDKETFNLSNEFEKTYKQYARDNQVKEFNIIKETLDRYYKAFTRSSTYRNLKRLGNYKRQIHAIDAALEILTTEPTVINHQAIEGLKKKRAEIENNIVKLHNARVEVDKFIENYNKLFARAKLIMASLQPYVDHERNLKHIIKLCEEKGFKEHQTDEDKVSVIRGEVLKELNEMGYGPVCKEIEPGVVDVDYSEFNIKYAELMRMKLYSNLIPFDEEYLVSPFQNIYNEKGHQK